MEKIIKIGRILKLVLKINWIKTIFINFKSQKFQNAIKLPILVFGKLNIYNLEGEIKINCPIRFGLILIGKDFDHFPNSTLPVKLLVKNKIIFNGPVIISGGTTITSWTGVINIGKYTSIGSGNVIKSSVYIELGDYSRVVSNCILMDTNVHFLIESECKIRNIFGEIIIGKYCWLNHGTIASKGTKIPDYSITARNSFLNKNYCNENEIGLFLVGSPAEIKSKGLKQIFNFQKELKLKNYFLENLDTTQVNKDFITDASEYKESDDDFKSFYKLF